MSQKTSLIVRLILMIILFLLVLMLAVQVVGKGWGFMSFSGSGELVYSKHYDDVTSIQADTASYALEVVEHDGSDVVAEFYRMGFGSVKDPTMEQQDGILSIRETETPLGIHFGSGKVILRVPKGSALPYRLHTASGSVRLGAASIEAVLQTVSGSIKVYQGGDLLTAETTSGSVKVYKPFDRLDIKTISGSIKAVADGGTTDVQMKSVSGSVKLKLDGVSGYTMEYSTVSGSVKNEYPAMEYNYGAYHKHGTAVWSDGSLPIRAETTSGSIKLTDWND